MAFIIDSNILCRLGDKNDPQHEEARSSMRLLLESGEDLFLIPQVEREFWVVSTRPRERNGLGLTATETDERLKEFREIMGFRLDQAGIHAKWRQLVIDHQVLGKSAHDAGIVAAALIHKVENILTFNTQDFSRYSGHVGIKAPQEVIERLTR